MKIAVIKWKDASVQTGDVHEESLQKECIMLTVGMFIDDEKDYISLASEIYEKQNTFRYVTHIPKGMIISKKFITLKKVKK